MNKSSGKLLSRSGWDISTEVQRHFLAGGIDDMLHVLLEKQPESWFWLEVSRMGVENRL